MLAVGSTVLAQRHAQPYDFPDSVDTRDHPIQLQEKRLYSDTANQVFATNDFPAARLNNFELIRGNLYKVTIAPENTPINYSPWYAFKIWSTTHKDIWVQFVYTYAGHRYIPKLSHDGEHWQAAAPDDFTFLADGQAVVHLDVSPDTLWVAAQEITDTRRVATWLQGLSADERVTVDTIGQSKLGRPLLFMDIHTGKTRKKDIIAIFSRQHPPEVTGFQALQAFVDELLTNERSAEFFKQYRVVVYPLLNPDGVDLGHWRHNAGGIDLNRDWAYYRQPETRQVADHLVNLAADSKSRVVLGIDFHSTQKDVFYTLPDSGYVSHIPWFKRAWLRGIEQTIGGDYRLNESPSGLGQPVSKGWFYTQFKAEGVTYEVGDETPRDFIRRKGQVAARVMIDVLLDKGGS